MTGDTMDEFLADFLKDTREDLSKIESSLVLLEGKIFRKEEFDYDIVNNIFRYFHSVKGSSGFFALKEVVRVAHEAENILDLYRKKQLQINSENINSIFKTLDFLKILIERIEKLGNDKGLESEADFIITELKNIENDKTKIKLAPENKPKKLEIFKKENIEEPSFEKKETFEIVLEEKSGLKNKESSDDFKKSSLTENEESIYDIKPKKFEIFEKEKSEINLIPKENVSLKNLEENDKKEKKTELTDIRIPTSKLDGLVNLLGELVIVEAMVSRHANDEILNIEMLRRSASQLSKITRDLQEIGLSMRMVSLSPLFQKMERLVRDVSRKSNKNVRLEIHGEETEIDKSIIQQLSNPLVHILRNAIDHGIESENERRGIKKNPEGKITLEAKHKGSEIWIIIKDDGAGLDREKILQKAIELKLLEENGAELSDQQVWNMIFHPGFSTAKEITDISGRGVGMDVVKKELNRLKGKIDVQSTFGQGTTFILRIPLTLAIID